MAFKVLAVLLLLTILTSLGMGLYYLMRDSDNSERTVKALTVRIVLSLVLFALLLVAAALGLISPHGPASG
jgi:succinate dehydrogenase hydrophobic anchor subunit